MNEIVNQFWLVGDKFLAEMHVSQPGFIFNVCRLFTKDKERIQKYKVTRDSKYIYRNKLDKAYFQLDTAYGEFKDLLKRTTSVLRDKAFDIAKI